MPSELWGTNASYFDTVSEQYKEYGYLKIDVYPYTGSGVLSYDTRKWGLVPCESLVLPPFEEKITTQNAPGWHGAQEKRTSVYFTDGSYHTNGRFFKNATGSWEFYYLPDGATRSPWDAEGIITQANFERPLNQGWMNRPYTWSAVYHLIQRALQGHKCHVFCNTGDHTWGAPDWGQDDSDPNNDKTGCDGKIWVSKIDTGSDNGLVKFTLSYDLAPSEAYEKITKK